MIGTGRVLPWRKSITGPERSPVSWPARVISATRSSDWSSPTEPCVETDRFGRPNFSPRWWTRPSAIWKSITQWSTRRTEGGRSRASANWRTRGPAPSWTVWIVMRPDPWPWCKSASGTHQASSSIETWPETSVASASTGAMYFSRSSHIWGVIGVRSKIRTGSTTSSGPPLELAADGR